MTTREPQQISTSNIEYNLVSVIYHKLESAVSTFVYVVDAQWAGDHELTQFFLNNYQEDRRTADRAEQLLSARLSQQQGQQQGQQAQQSQQAQFGQGQGQFGQGQFGQGQFGQGQGQFGQGQYPDPRMYSGSGQGMYGSGMGGYGHNPGMYGASMMGGYGYNPGMYGGGMGGYGSGQGMYGGGMSGGQFGGGQFGGNQSGGGQSGMSDLRQITGTSDVTFDLISTIYHALKEAQTLKAYVQDGQKATDQEIAQFFQQITEQVNRCADQARRLLAPRLSYKQMRQGYYGGPYGSQAGQPVGAGTDTGATAGRTVTASSDTGTRR